MNNNNNPTNGSQACAACKYQRRKCAPDCLLAPYFPPQHPKHFLNAHKLFGVSNITKTLKNIAGGPREKEIAMKCMIFQANVRANDPVGGCYRMIRDLQQQIDQGTAELKLALHQLALCRMRAQMMAEEEEEEFHEEENNNAGVVDVDVDPLSMMYNQYGVVAQENYDYSQQEYNLCSVKRKSETLSPSCSTMIQMHGKEPFVEEECEDIKPILGLFDDTQPPPLLIPFDFKESTLCSDKAVIKQDVGSIHH